MNFKSLTTNIQCGATIKSRLIVDYKFNDKRSSRLSHFSTSWTEIIWHQQHQPFPMVKPARTACWCSRRTIKNQSGNGLCMYVCGSFNAAAVRLIQLVLIKERPSPRSLAAFWCFTLCARNGVWCGSCPDWRRAAQRRIHSVWIIINHFVIYYYFDAISSRQKIAHRTFQN